MSTFKAFKQDLNEVLITLGTKAYPKFGNIVILAGGAGSGKGFVTQNLLGLEGKILDVDALKELAMKSTDLRARIKKQYGKDIKDFKLKNPEDVKELHAIVKDIDLSDRKNKALFDAISTAPEDRKPNIIFDVTLDNVGKFQKIAEKTAELGYKKENIHIVWVVNDIKVAQEQNQDRERVVPEEILIGTHKGASATMEHIITLGKKLKRYMDGAIVLAFNKKGSDSSVKASKTGGFYVVDSKYVTVKEKGKPMNGAKISKDVEAKLQTYTPSEKDFKSTDKEKAERIKNRKEFGEPKK